MLARGCIPTTAIWVSYLLRMYIAVEILVFDILLQLVLLYWRLFVPNDRIHFPGLVGKPPWSIRHKTFSARSPPIPQFDHPGSFACESERRGGRNNRSMKESPIRQLLWLLIRPSLQCWLNFSPQLCSGLERFFLLNGQGIGLMKLCVNIPFDRFPY